MGAKTVLILGWIYYSKILEYSELCPMTSVVALSFYRKLTMEGYHLLFRNLIAFYSTQIIRPTVSRESWSINP